MQSLWSDLRYAARMLAANPGFTLVATLSLALGVGLNTTVFSILNGLVLKPLPGREPQQLVSILKNVGQGPLRGGFSYADALDYGALTDVFDGVVAFDELSLHYGPLGQAERMRGEIVSSNLFDVLGLPPVWGRSFAAGAAGTEGAVVISHALWQRRFDAAPGVLGRVLLLNGHSYSVIGVAPPSFRGLAPGPAVDVWLPLEALPRVRPGSNALENRGERWLSLAARLKPGVGLGQAAAALEAHSRVLEKEYPGTNQGVTATVAPSSRVSPRQQAKILPVFALMFGFVLVVLLIACANVANLLLARAVTRAREIGVRLALGASRARLVGQLLTESLLLAVIGAAVGLLFASWTADLLLSALPGIEGPLSFDLKPDQRVLAFNFLVALAATLAFGLLPALQAARLDVLACIKNDGVTPAAMPRLQMRRSLAMAQVALSLLLMISAGLLGRAMLRVTTIDPGFDTRNVLAVSLDLPLYGYQGAAANQFVSAVLEESRRLPGVESVSVAAVAPLGNSFMSQGISFMQPAAGTPVAQTSVGYNVISPGFFSTIGAGITAGRDFDARDTAQSTQAAIVNQAFADRFWPGQTPLGRHFFEGSKEVEVVGVARTFMYRALGEPPQPHYYRPWAQSPRSEPTLLVRSSQTTAVFAGLRTVLAALDSRFQVFEGATLAVLLERFHQIARVAAAAATAFATLALVLAVLGVYGVVTYSVSRRIREIGIRVALGARPVAVLGMVLRQGATLWLGGALLGIAAALAISQCLERVGLPDGAGTLYGVSASDPLTYGLVSALLLAVVLLAAYLPARRATRVDPMAALRHE
jgi:predicted permease